MVKSEPISFEVPGEPKGKGRPRFSGFYSKKKENKENKPKGERPHVYTPDSTVEYEEKVKSCAEHISYVFSPDVPLELSVKAYYKIPKRVSKRTRQQMIDEEILPVKKPDHDNVLKIISDALNKVVYEDDAQINESHFKKVYGDPPRTEVKIKVVETEPKPKRPPATRELEEALREMGEEWRSKRGLRK